MILVRINNKQPVRTCVGCNGKHAQSTLMRVASHGSALPVFDPQRREPGRGVWLCRNVKCVEQAWQRQAIARGLKLKLTTPEERAALVALKDNILRALSDESSC